MNAPQLARIAARIATTAGMFVVLASGVSPAAQKKEPPAKPIDLNSATLEQLQQLPGVGPATAKAIVQFREKSGPFKRVEDLLAIRGITKQRLEKIRPYVRIGPKEAGKARPST